MTRTVNRALDVLEAVRDASEPISLTDLARVAGVDKATAKRIATDLVGRRYLEYLNNTKRYTLGFNALKLGNRSLGHDSTAQKTLRYLEDLRDKTLQTVALCSRADQHYVVALELMSLEPIKFSRGIGSTFLLGEDAPGMAILGLPTPYGRMIDGTSYTYSCSISLPHVATVAAPIVHAGQTASAVCLSWVVERPEHEEPARLRFGAQVVATAHRLSQL